MDVEFADLDGNNQWELYVASSDGYIYAFEMNTSSAFEPFNLVWKSTFLVKALSLSIGDLTGDSRMELVVAGWRNRAYVYGYGNLTTNWENLHVLWESNNLRDQILETAIGDFNGDSNLDIALALRHGKILIFERVNNKTLCSQTQSPVDDDHDDEDDDDHDSNGEEKSHEKEKKPRDSEECFNLTYSTSDYLWNTIIQLESFDLDLDGDQELGIVVKAQDVFILDFGENGYFMDRITTLPQLWEKSGAYPIDYFPDKMLYSNNTLFDGVVPEPMSWLDPRNLVSPYTSGLEANNQDHFTRFTGTDSWALIDWGSYEEMVGGGNGGTDVIFYLENPYDGPLDNLSIILINEIEDDGEEEHETVDWLSELQEIAINDHHHHGDDETEHYEHSHEHDEEHEEHDEYAIIETISMSKSADNLSVSIDIDPSMLHSKMISARYMYIWFNNSDGKFLDIKSIEATRINSRLSSVRSIGYDTAVLDPSSNKKETPILIASTAGGNMLIFASTKTKDQNTPLVQIVRNSYQDQRFTIGPDGAWDIKPIPTASTVPNWINPQIQATLSDLLKNRIKQFFVGKDLDPTIPSSASFAGDLFIVLEGPEILWLPDPSSLSSSSIIGDSQSVFGNVIAHYSSLGADTISIALADLELSPNSPVPYGNYPELVISYGDMSFDVWSLDSSFEFQFSKTIPFTEIKATNQTLQEMLQTSGTAFQLTAGDFDADGHDDIAFTNGTALYLITTNKTGNQTSYVVDEEFFASIEKAISSSGYHFFRRTIENIAAIDANGDNATDLMMSLFPRPGFTFFENRLGSLNEDEGFIEKRSLVHYRPLRTTLTNYNYEFAAIWGTNEAFPISSAVFLAVNQTNDVSMWKSSQEFQRSWIVVTSNRIVQLTTNLADTSSGYNWGFQYFEQWSDDIKTEHRSHHHEHEHDGHDSHDKHDDYIHDLDDHYHDEDEFLEDILLEPSIIIKSGDTDGDGLIDGLEGFSRIDALKTNIADPDTDGDGLSDTLELCVGLNPRSDDTDGDLVPDALDLHDWWSDYKEHCLSHQEKEDDEDDHDTDHEEESDNNHSNQSGDDNKSDQENEEEEEQSNSDTNHSNEDTETYEQNYVSPSIGEQNNAVEITTVQDENSQDNDNKETSKDQDKKDNFVSVGAISSLPSKKTLVVNEITFKLRDSETRAIRTEYLLVDRTSIMKEQTLFNTVAIRSFSSFFPQEILTISHTRKP